MICFIARLLELMAAKPRSYFSHRCLLKRISSTEACYHCLDHICALGAGTSQLPACSQTPFPRDVDALRHSALSGSCAQCRAG